MGAPSSGAAGTGSIGKAGGAAAGGGLSDEDALQARLDNLRKDG